MKYPKMKYDEPRAYLYDEFYVGLGGENAQLSDSKNFYFADNVFKTRPAMRTDRSKIICTAGKNDDLSLSLTDAAVFLSNEYHRIAYVQNTDYDSYMDYNFYLIDESGKSRDFGSISFYRASSTNVNLPENCVVFTGKKTVGDGIYAIFDSIHEGDIYIYEYSFEDARWNRITTTQTYKPVIYKNGRGNQYKYAKGVYETPSYSEQINMLNPEFVISYTTDGVSTAFKFPKGNFSMSENDYMLVELSDTDGSVYEWRIAANQLVSDAVVIGGNNVRVMRNPYSSGIELFGETQYVAPQSDINPNNLKITFHLEKKENIDKISGMEHGKWYGSGTSGSRLCLAGNYRYPSLLCVSQENEPLYFPENNQLYVGDPAQKITAISRQNKSLVILKEKEIYSCLFTSGKFNIMNIHSSIGCDLPKTLQMCDNRLVWTNKNGCVYMLATLSQYSITAVYKLSGNISDMLENEKGFFGAVACASDDRYMLFLENRVYVMDYKKCVRKNSREFVRGISWFKWELPSEIKTSAALADGNKMILILSSNDSEQVIFSADLEADTAKDIFIDGNSQLIDRFIDCFADTVLFDGGKLENIKIYSDIYIRMFAQHDVKINYLDTKGDTVRNAVINIEYTDDGVAKAYRLLPLVRTETLGLSIKFIGRAQLDGIVFYCKSLNKIR